MSNPARHAPAKHDGDTQIPYPPTDPTPFDLVARAMHERACERNQGCPVWEDLDLADTWHAGLIRVAYERARDFIAMSGGVDEAGPIETRSPSAP